MYNEQYHLAGLQQYSSLRIVAQTYLHKLLVSH